jgi:hypothetical protein
VVLVRLHAVEVGTLTLREAVLTVELDLGDLNRVLALALDTRGEDDLGEEVVGGTLEDAVIISEVGLSGVDTRASGETSTRSETKTDLRDRDRTTDSSSTGTKSDSGQSGSVASKYTTSTAAIGSKSTVTKNVGDDTLGGPVIRVVEGLLSGGFRDPRHRGRVAVDEGVALDNPDEFLHGVVEVHLDLVGGGSHGLITSELNLVDEVLVGLLGKTSALLGIEVDVVDVERSSNKLELRDGRNTVTEVDDGTSLVEVTIGGSSSDVVTIAAVVVLLELNVDADLVVLEGDEGDGKTGVAAVPELERDVESLHGGTSARHTRVGELRSSAGGIESDTARRLEEDEISGVTDHLIERDLGTYGLSELSPDLHPVTVLTVDTGATNLDLNLLDESVTHIVEPSEAITGGSEGHLGKGNLDVGAVHQISISADNGSYTATEVSLTVEGNFDCLHSEVSMPLVEHLPEGDLRVARDINILCTIAYELH